MSTQDDNNPKDVVEFDSAKAKYYDELDAIKVFSEGVLAMMQKWDWYQKSTPSSLDILDFGCGNGFTTIGIAKHHENSSLTAVDVSDHMLERFRYRLENESASCKDRIQILHTPKGDVNEELPKESMFDYIFVNFVLHHVYPTDRRPILVQSLAKRLKPNGRLIVSEIDFTEKSQKAMAAFIKLKSENKDKQDNNNNKDNHSHEHHSHEHHHHHNGHGGDNPHDPSNDHKHDFLESITVESFMTEAGLTIADKNKFSIPQIDGLEIEGYYVQATK